MATSRPQSAAASSTHFRKVHISVLGITMGMALLLEGCTHRPSTAAFAGTNAPPQSASSEPPPVDGTATPGTPLPSGQPAKPIDQAEAEELFRSVDQIMAYASKDSGLPIKSKVKRRLTTRDEVEKYVLKKFNEDEDAARMQRAEVVLKKFGLIDRDFHLRNFLVSLLKEQIAGYYDNKTKMVNLLDWIDPENQKPVLAHELTHALQDQHTDLEKWGNVGHPGIPKNVEEDNVHLSADESDSARDAVLEGQAMAVFMDYSLEPLHKNLATGQDIVEQMKAHMSDTSDSPVLARAPILLTESLIFPYREGLTFEQSLLSAKGKNAAFTGALDHPPDTSWEILNPLQYVDRITPPKMVLPDVHPLLDAEWEPYDVGAVGELDVRIFTTLFAGESVANALAPGWRGGMYYAAMSRKATTPEQRADTASLALFYLSVWKTEAEAKKFASLYAQNLGRTFSGLAESSVPAQPGERIWNTTEGPVLIKVEGNQVFLSESFPLETARKLQAMAGAVQPSASDIRTAGVGPDSVPGNPRVVSQESLGAALSHSLNSFGVLRFSLPKR